MNLAVFDLETNGYPGTSVLSASSIAFDEAGRILGIFNRFYLPAEPFNPWLFRIHGLTPGRLLAIRARIPSPPAFIEDLPELVDFWTRWDVEGLVIHNARFDMAFLPEAVQSALPCWCSMKGLTELCALPARAGRGGGRFKWPRLGETVDILCDGPDALDPPEQAAQVERALTRRMPHVSLADCLALYRVASRVLTRTPELIRFERLFIPFRPPPGPSVPICGRAREDAFVRELLDLDQRLRELAKIPDC